MSEEQQDQQQDQQQQLSPDELMAQQYAQDAASQEEQSETQEAPPSQGESDEGAQETAMPSADDMLSPDELMAQQAAQESYGANNTTSTNKDDGKMSLLLDIPLEVAIEVGSTEMALEDVLKLNPNSVIELDRYINEPIDLKVNGKIIAKGELYTVKNNFGIRITHIITPEDRLKILEE